MYANINKSFFRKVLSGIEKIVKIFSIFDKLFSKLIHYYVPLKHLALKSIKHYYKSLSHRPLTFQNLIPLYCFDLRNLSTVSDVPFCHLP